MNDINPQNFDGANITVVGRAGGEYQVKEFPNGGSVAELSIAVGKGYKKDGEWVDQGTDWYTLSASPDYASDNWPEVGKGDKVRVDNARFQTRDFDRKDGSHDKSLDLKYGTLTVVSRKSENATAAAPAESTGGFGVPSDTPW